MKIILDNQIIKVLASTPAKILNTPTLVNVEYRLSFRWPSLLEYLGLGSLFSSLPPFGQNDPIFEAAVEALCANEETEVLFHLYDRLFAENLNQIKALPQINPSFLLEAIQKQRQKALFLEVKEILSPVLDAYEIAFTEKASHTMHDLILYLAWDRMCVGMARLFDYQSTDPTFIKGIGVLRECLIESYQHIAQQGRTAPGIYRMLESFVFYHMREENLGKLTAEEWTTLSQSFQALKAQEELADCFYIDDAVISEAELKMNEDYYLTLDSPNRVNARLSLAQCLMDKLKSEGSNWPYILRPKKVVYLEL